MQYCDLRTNKYFLENCDEKEALPLVFKDL